MDRIDLMIIPEFGEQTSGIQRTVLRLAALVPLILRLLHEGVFQALSSR